VVREADDDVEGEAGRDHAEVQGEHEAHVAGAMPGSGRVPTRQGSTTEVAMPPRGVKKGSKRERQYDHIKKSAKDRGASEGRAEEMAARTVNKERARSGESRTRSRSSTKGSSPSRRGGRRSGDSPTRDELYEQAKQLGIEGRSKMNKQQLARAVGRKAK
jgi:Rho termination factor, N-terminal domain